MAKARKNARRLAAGDLELLQALWQSPRSTIADIHRMLGRVAYTTVQTRLNRLVDKGLARRSAERPARYRAAITRDRVSAGDLAMLLNRVSEGEVVPLVAHLVQQRTLSADELARIRRLIDEAEQRLAESPPELD